MKLYLFIKDLLLFGVLGFIIVPIKFVFWIFSQEGKTTLANLPSYLRGGDNVSIMPGLTLLFRTILWCSVAYVSLGVFGALNAVITGDDATLQKYISHIKLENTEKSIDSDNKAAQDKADSVKESSVQLSNE